jgi:3-isopropylmalate/(R)-2-methylmalate dehydratase large subunit
VVDARPDIVLSHDNTAAIAGIFRSLGVQKVVIPERLAITLDHAVPAPTPKHAQNHAEVRLFVQEQGIRHFYEVGRGICHQVLSEEAILLPGQLLLGADSHSTHYGWMGAFGAGIGRTETAALWATGELWLRVPDSMKIEVNGVLGRGVNAKDLCLHIIGQLGADGGLYLSVEFSGPAIERMSLDSRMVIPNMMAEFGVKNAYLPPDEAVLAYLAPPLARRIAGDPQAGHDAGRLRECEEILRAGAITPDPDAVYASEYTFDASAIEPLVACPHQVDAVQPVSTVTGVKVHQAFLGTCTNGRLEDLSAAAEIVKGRRVAPGVRFLVIPASSEVLAEGMRLGVVQVLLEAGAVLGVPGCGPCMGNHLGVLAPGEVCISSANRNFKGRMGQPEAEIYLSSPAVVAASALAGRIADPRETG